MSVCEGVCVCLRIFSCETSITGAVNYDQFVQLLHELEGPSPVPRGKAKGARPQWVLACCSNAGPKLIVSYLGSFAQLEPAVRYLVYLLLHNLTHYHITGRHRIQCFVEWRPALPWSPPSTTAPCSLTWQCTVVDQHSRIKQTCVYTVLRLRN